MDQPQQPNSRLMQVKVLYTFNDENKSNCLARCQLPLSIQTAKLDPSTEIGIIELRTCIQAIVSASPELVAKLGHDYTIYAYDYSEYETPLVGQGMLSWVLASSSSTPNAPADQSRTMVTGRVCKNVLALFSEGAKETLEVKLRLVPVPTCLQSEYLASMEKYRNTSTVADQNLDTAAWATFLHANPNFGAVDLPPTPTNYYAPQPQYAQPSHTGLPTSHYDPNFHTLDLPGSTSNQQATSQASRGGSKSSRPSTPSEARAPTQRKNNPPSRPSSRASARPRPSLKQTASCASRVESTQVAYTSEAEEGPSRKRARVTKADWPGTSSFGTQSDSLRVTAATAASIRGTRPSTGGHPSVSDLASGEIGERPPTPRPQTAKGLPPVPISRSLTNTAHEIMTNKTARASSANLTDYMTPYESSPEKRDESTGSTPFEFPSSPPVMQRPSPTPSSPPLPRLPRHHDSGFVSGTIEEDLFQEQEVLPPIEVPHQYKQNKASVKPEPTSSEVVLDQSGSSARSVESAQSETHSGKNQKSKKSASARPSPKPRPTSRKGTTSAESPSNSEALSEANIDHAGSRPDEAVPNPQIVRGHSQLATSVGPNSLSRERSESCAIDTGSCGASPEVTNDAKQTKPRQNSVMHEKKKRAIQVNLAQAIQAGQMPRFCKNCGAISTPTWRIAFVKTEEGQPNHAALSDPENGIITWEPVEKDDQGQITSYRIIKKTVGSEETGFESLDLCNSCGVWLFKNKCMRPLEWAAKGSGPKPKPAPRKHKKKKPEQGVPTSDAPAEVNQEPQSQSLAESREGADHSVHNEGTSVHGGDSSSDRKTRAERANSVGSKEAPRPAAPLLEKSGAAAALRRAIQSSPPRFPGSKFSPIEIDPGAKVSPQPTRRLLFPSPRKPGEMKSLEDPVESSSKAKSGKDNDTADKDDEDDGLDHLFEKDDNARSVDRSNRSSTSKDPLKTPARNSAREGSIRKSGHLTSAAKRWRASNPATPSRGGDNDFSLHIDQMTPFTRQLTQLISEANQSSEDNDPTFDPMNPNIDVPGVFTFSDFSPGDFGAAAAAGGGAGGDAEPSFFGLYDGQNPSSEAFWETGNQDMDSAIDAFLESERMEDSNPATTV